MAVLIADTDINHLQQLYDHLKEQGHSVVVTDNGIQAAQYILDRHFSLILADCDLPGKNGFELLEKTKKTKPHVSFILMSENGGVSIAVEAIKKGAADFLVKPISTELLLETVKAYTSQALDSLEKNISSGAIQRPIITENQQMKQILQMAERIAPSHAPVLIQGESGTGKELLARHIHSHSGRQKKAFVAINCAALPANLLESELFGYEKGAFTGAITRRTGKFELSSGGTLLLDEISEIPIHLQAKLLRVLQENEIDRIGGNKPISIDVRILATTNVNLENAVEKKEFRQDLYYRLNVITLDLPPLRKRQDDIMPLTRFFLKKYNNLNGTNVRNLDPDAKKLLLQHRWEGNVRELENVIQRAVLLCLNGTITPDLLWLSRKSPSAIENIPTIPLKQMERIMIDRALEETDGNRTRAARVLGISVRTLRNKLNEYKKSAGFHDTTGRR